MSIALFDDVTEDTRATDALIAQLHRRLCVPDCDRFEEASRMLGAPDQHFEASALSHVQMASRLLMDSRLD